MSLFNSIQNSFPTPKTLEPGEVAYGIFEPVFNFHGVMCHVMATQAYKVELEFSEDQTTILKRVDITDDAHSHVQATYFRIRIANTALVSNSISATTYCSLNPISTASATSDHQVVQTSRLDSINTKLNGVLHVVVDNQTTGQALESTQQIVKQELINIDNKLPALGPQALTGSLPVVITPNPTNLLPIRLAEVASGSNIAQDSTLTLVKQGVVDLNAKLPATLGAKPTTGSLSVVIAPDSNVLKVKIDELATGLGLALDSTLIEMKGLQETGNSTLFNGLGSINTRLQGWDNAVSSIASYSQATAGRLPTSLGQKTTAQSLSVCLSSDTTGLPITASTPLKVKVEQYGSFGNLCNGISLAPLASSSSLNIADYAYLHGFYEDTTTSSYQGLLLEYSVDNINFYPSNANIYPNVPSGDTKRRYAIYRQDVGGINYVRVKNTSTVDTMNGVVVSIFGASLG